MQRVVVPVDVLEADRADVLVAQARVQREHQAVATDRGSHRRDPGRVVREILVGDPLALRLGRVLIDGARRVPAAQLALELLVERAPGRRDVRDHRFASGAPLSLAGFVPVRLAARSLIC